jgi:hypothetical protein
MAYLKNGGTLEKAAAMANHRHGVSLDEVGTLNWWAAPFPPAHAAGTG